MHVIPAIDLLDGACVRLHKGNYDQATVYNKDPISQAKIFTEAGFSHIHVVDLNGAKQGEFVNLGHIQEMIHHLGLSVQTGEAYGTSKALKNYLMPVYPRLYAVLWLYKMRLTGYV